MLSSNKSDGISPIPIKKASEFHMEPFLFAFDPIGGKLLQACHTPFFTPGVFQSDLFYKAYLLSY